MRILAYILPAIAVFIACNVLLTFFELPLYGTWSGLRPLEEKLELYEQATKQRLTDKIILGSSLTEAGCSAKTLNEWLLKHGQDGGYFNLAEGGAHLQTQVVVYRISRAIARPKTVLLGVLIMGTDSDYFASEDEPPVKIMKKSPAGAMLDSDLGLAASYRVWQLPIFKFAAPVRDLVIYGDFKNRVFDYTDHQGRNKYGDLLPYAVCYDIEKATSYADTQKQRLLNMWRLAGTAGRFVENEWPVRMKRLAHLKSLTEKDGASLMLYPIMPGYMAMHEDEVLLEIQNETIKELARRLACQYITFEKPAQVRPYELVDPVHLNRHGSEFMARRIAAAMLQQDEALNAEQPTPRFLSPRKYPTDKKASGWGKFTSAIVKHNIKSGDTLDIHLLQGWNIPKLPIKKSVKVKVFYPNGMQEILPAQIKSSDGIAVQFGPDSEINKNQNNEVVLLISILDAKGKVINIPLKDYSWHQSNERHHKDNTSS